MARLQQERSCFLPSCLVVAPLRMWLSQSAPSFAYCRCREGRARGWLRAEPLGRSELGPGPAVRSDLCWVTSLLPAWFPNCTGVGGFCTSVCVFLWAGISLHHEEPRTDGLRLGWGQEPGAQRRGSGSAVRGQPSPPHSTCVHISVPTPSQPGGASRPRTLTQRAVTKPSLWQDHPDPAEPGLVLESQFLRAPHLPQVELQDVADVVRGGLGQLHQLLPILKRLAKLLHTGLYTVHAVDALSKTKVELK